MTTNITILHQSSKSSCIDFKHPSVNLTSDGGWKPKRRTQGGIGINKTEWEEREAEWERRVRTSESQRDAGRIMQFNGDCWAVWLLCDLHGRRLGSENERAHSCGFSDLWSYKYPVCGQLRSSSIHDLLTAEPRQEKERVNTCWSGWLRGVLYILYVCVWVSGRYIYHVLSTCRAGQPYMLSTHVAQGPTS